MKSCALPPAALPASRFLTSAQNAGIVSLNRELRGIRQSYLSTAPPPRRAARAQQRPPWRHLTERQKDEIDAETKNLLRDLDWRIQSLAGAETTRQETEQAVRKSKYARMGLGAWGNWAAGGRGPPQTPDEQLDEARSKQVKVHRESVLWYLREKLQECGKLQAGMMEKRIMRQLEKNKSMISKSRMGRLELGGFDPAPIPPANPSAEQEADPGQDTLTPEQIQMFEKEEQDMLKHYESTLDQVRWVGKRCWQPRIGGAKRVTGRPRNRSSRSRSCRPSWSTTWRRSRHTSSSWSRIPSSRPRTSEAGTSN